MSPEGRLPLVPLLGPGELSNDPDTLETWYLALSNGLSSDLPHDLLGVWLYPAAGGSELIAPAALAADHLVIPRPPDLSIAQLELLEEIIRDAGYRSAMAIAIGGRERASGLLLLAALAEDLYGPDERSMAEGVAGHLAPMFTRLARTWGSPPVAESAPPSDDVLGAVARVSAAAENPKALARGLRETLAPRMAVDRIELLVRGSTSEQWYRLGEHPGGPLWSDPDLVITSAELDVPALFGVADVVLRDDAAGTLRFPGDSGAAVRSVAGVWLEVAGHKVGALLVGALESGRYGEADVALLRSVAPLVAIRVDACVAAGHLQIVRSHLATLRAVPAHLGRLAEMLASTSDPAEATRRFALEAGAVLGFERLHFALALSEEDRVAVVAPGETRALLDLPLTPITGTGLGRVVRGELPNLTVRAERRADLIVALRVAGRVIGAMVLTGSDEAMFGRGDVEIAQQLADLIAPHLELVRRTAVAPPPMMPGWKRAPRF